MARAHSTNHSRLSVDDWIQAGLRDPGREGIKALKIDRLCRRLWSDQGQLLLAFHRHRGIPRRTRAGVGRVARRGAAPLRANSTALPPRERLSQMMSSLVSPNTGRWNGRCGSGPAPTTTPPPACAPPINGCSRRYARPSWTTGSTARTPRCAPTPHSPAGVGFLHLSRARSQALERSRRPGTLPRHHAQGLTAQADALRHTKKYGTVGRMSAYRPSASGVRGPASPSAPQEAERLRRLPPETVDDLVASGFHRTAGASPLRRHTGRLSGDPRSRSAGWRTAARPAHGRSASTRCTTGCWRCSTSARRRRLFATRPFLAPAPLAPTGRGRAGRRRRAAERPVVVGNRCDGCATGSSSAHCAGPRTDLYPALALLPADDDSGRWTSGTPTACGPPAPTTSIIDRCRSSPTHRLVRVSDIYAGTAPGAGLHDAATYRWPMVPAWRCWPRCPHWAVRRRVADIYAERLSERVLAYEGVKQKDKPIGAGPPRRGAGAVARAARAARRHGRTDREHRAAGDPVPRPVRAEARLAAAHIVHESRAVIADLLEASGASAHFLEQSFAARQARRRRHMPATWCSTTTPAASWRGRSHWV